MVVNHNASPVFINSPEITRKWLRYRIETGEDLKGYGVRIGSTMKIVTVSQYLDGKRRT